MANGKIFCNSPWYELHIYWDGSLGICCQESHKLYTGDSYNIATTTIADWFNSTPVRNFRLKMLEDTKLSECAMCYHEEEHNGISRRMRCNTKSAIFPIAFNDSFMQSPIQKHILSNGFSDTQPIDLHIDLGNYCNLACKMCRPEASSTIAAQHVKWGNLHAKKFIGTNWTQDPEVWGNFKLQLLEIPNLSNIHFMGGETLISPAFEDLIDTLISHKRFDIGVSFVTNGTIFNQQLVDKLTQFRRVGIEVSIETHSGHNSYIRQGTDTDGVITNIQSYITKCNNTTISVSLRPAISALSIGYYDTLLSFANKNKLLISSLIVISPKFMHVSVLPEDVKQVYLKRYQLLLESFRTVPTSVNVKNPTNFQYVIKQQIEQCISLLQSPTPLNVTSLQKELVDHCKKWDQEYQLNASDLYSELYNMWVSNGY